MNNSRGRKNLEFMKSPMKHEKVITGVSLAFKYDVIINELKKKLRHEENVHRALERAFTRPLGALPRLPPYLSPYTLELVAEVAVLEEEVVRLEEQVLHFRQALNSSSMWNFENDGGWKENQPGISSARNNRLTNPKVQTMKTPPKRPPNVCRPAVRLLDPHKLQNQELWTTKVKKTNAIRDQRSSGDENPNKISEDIVRCLSSILLRLSSSKDRATSDTLPSLSVLNSGGILEATGFKDLYGIGSVFGRRDIGPYKHLLAVEALSINPTRKTNSAFLIRRLKILLGKLAFVKLKGLTHQKKLAFWINTHNSCVMNV
ncbi:hypothetical protein Vadar_025231 [Vaccinium darrowii]|uniref:Uncharacterized protein n=1 Tax=Vaccinium darrowii TaxID=229202 RepID=A0ACB7Y357_9ERIC|nr:hypothetical protein Vadar_025231 [Vaccinium darrowii]